MAGTTRTNVAQTAFNNATNAVVALIAKGEVSKENTATAIKALASDLLTALESVRAADEDNTKQLNYKPRSYGGGNRGGGSQDVATIKFKGTKFDGKTIDEVYKMGASEASQNHGYNDQSGNPQPGKNFVTWLATKDGFMAGKCKTYLEKLSEAPAAAPAAEAPATTPDAQPAVQQTDQEFSFGGGDW